MEEEIKLITVCDQVSHLQHELAVILKNLTKIDYVMDSQNDTSVIGTINYYLKDCRSSIEILKRELEKL